MNTTPERQESTTMLPVVLHQTAPWNPALINGYRTRWTEVAGRYFKIYAEYLYTPWHIEETDENGIWLQDSVLFPVCLTLAEARQAISRECTKIIPLDEDATGERPLEAVTPSHTTKRFNDTADGQGYLVKDGEGETVARLEFWTRKNAWYAWDWADGHSLLRADYEGQTLDQVMAGLDEWL